MRIEETPYHFGISPLEKLRKNQSTLDFTLDDFDLSFLDLLNTVAGTDAPDMTDDVASNQDALTGHGMDKTAAKEKTEVKSPPKLSLVGKVSASAPVEEPPAVVSKDMTLLQDDLSDIDVQYMKQVVIPGLPILLGSVPTGSIFPAEADGGFSYKGFEISPKLAELIEKGYKSGRPIRVELDPKSAVVLKFRNGQVSAEFVSMDKTAAMVMQQELDDLRNRMALKNLPVGTLEAKYQNPNQSRQNNKRDEDDDEEHYTES